MDEQQRRAPNLEELDEKDATCFLADVFFSGPIPDPEVVYEANHPDHYVVGMPQSGECVSGRENMRKFQEAYPGSPSIRLRRVLVRDGLWVAEVVNDYGGGLRRGDDTRAQGREDMAGQALLRRAFRGS